MGSFEVGQGVWIICNGRSIEEAVVVKSAGGMCTLRFTGRNGGTRLRESRLFASKEEAKAYLQDGTVGVAKLAASIYANGGKGRKN